MESVLDLEYYWSVAKSVLAVIPTTLSLTFFAFFGALALSITLAVIEYFKVPVLHQISKVYVSFFRGTPMIPQLFLLYFGLPSVIPALKAIPAFTICVVGLTLNSAAYMKEVIRGALFSVPHGQKEAALAHGMTSLQAMFRIILPQTARVAVPGLFNDLVDIVKGSSVAFTIGIVEMTATAKLRAAASFNYFETYMVLMLCYWGIVLLLERVSAQLESRLAKSYR